MPIAKESKTYEPAPAGTHIARCFACIGLGTQHSEQYADSYKVQLMFELPHETIQIDGQPMPMTISKDYSLSLGKKASLRKALDSWRGKPFTPEELEGFEVSKVVGAPCQLTIVHKLTSKGEMGARIETITGLAKGMICPPQVHASVKYEIEEGESSETFRKLPEWVQKKIRTCEEWLHPKIANEPDQERPTEAPGGMEDTDSEVPF